MASIKTRQQLPDLASLPPTSSRVWLQLGTRLRVPTPDPAKRVQIREEKHYVPARWSCRSPPRCPGREVPADRRHQRRLPGRRQHPHPRRPAQQAPVHPGPHPAGQLRGRHREGGARLQLLGAAFNARHGKGIDREEIRKAVETIGQDPTYDGTRIAALIGVTDATVKSMLAEMKARARARASASTSTARSPRPRCASSGRRARSSTTTRSGRSHRSRRTPACPRGLREVIKQMHEAKSDEGAVAVVEEHRKARREQIAEYRASGKSKPPPRRSCASGSGSSWSSRPAEGPGRTEPGGRGQAPRASSARSPSFRRCSTRTRREVAIARRTGAA